MIRFSNTGAPFGALADVDPSKITTAKLGTVSGILRLTHKDKNTVTQVINVHPPDSYDLYTVLQSLNSVTCSTAAN